MNAIYAIHPYRHEGLWVFDEYCGALLAQWNNPDSGAHDDCGTVVTEWNDSSRRTGCCEEAASRLADWPRHVVAHPACARAARGAPGGPTRALPVRDG